MSVPSFPHRPFWFPFSWSEVEIGASLLGIVGTSLTLFGVSASTTALLTALLASTLYFAGLHVHRSKQIRTFDFLEDGALRGQGYVPFFREARRSLFLTHTDDDTPSAELLAVYGNLLERGVEMRRVIMLRHDPRSCGWIARFGAHERLVQRVIPARQAQAMPFSFVVVDESTVLISVPGSGPIDDQQYAHRFVLRHLLVMHDVTVARVFLRMHEELWARATPIQSVLEPAGEG